MKQDSTSHYTIRQNGITAGFLKLYQIKLLAGRDYIYSDFNPDFNKLNNIILLGASVGSIVGLLSKDFIVLVLIAFVIASPVAWYIMHQWLQDFAYRTDIEWWVFAVAGLLAAVANPVKSLRSE